MADRADYPKPPLRRPHRPDIVKKIAVLMPLVPMSYYVGNKPVDNVIFRYYVTANGSLSDTTFVLATAQEDLVAEIEVQSPGRVTKVDVPVVDGVNIIPDPIEVAKGIFVFVRLKTVSGVEPVANDIYVAATFKPDPEGAIAQRNPEPPAAPAP